MIIYYEIQMDILIFGSCAYLFDYYNKLMVRKDEEGEVEFIILVLFSFLFFVVVVLCVVCCCYLFFFAFSILAISRAHPLSLEPYPLRFTGFPFYINSFLKTSLRDLLSLPFSENPCNIVLAKCRNLTNRERQLLR